MFIYSYDEMNLCFFFFFFSSTPCQFSSFPQLLHSIPISLLRYIYHLAINTVFNFYFSSFSVTVAATLFSLGSFFRYFFFLFCSNRVLSLAGSHSSIGQFYFIFNTTAARTTIAITR